mgnify:CR=1 FL=1
MISDRLMLRQVAGGKLKRRLNAQHRLLLPLTPSCTT